MQACLIDPETLFPVAVMCDIEAFSSMEDPHNQMHLVFSVLGAQPTLLMKFADELLYELHTELLLADLISSLQALAPVDAKTP